MFAKVQQGSWGKMWWWAMCMFISTEKDLILDLWRSSAAPANDVVHSGKVFVFLQFPWKLHWTFWFVLVGKACIVHCSHTYCVCLIWARSSRKNTTTPYRLCSCTFTGTLSHSMFVLTHSPYLSCLVFLWLCQYTSLSSWGATENWVSSWGKRKRLVCQMGNRENTPVWSLSLLVFRVPVLRLLPPRESFHVMDRRYDQSVKD